MYNIEARARHHSTLVMLNIYSRLLPTAQQRLGPGFKTFILLALCSVVFVTAKTSASGTSKSVNEEPVRRTPQLKGSFIPPIIATAAADAAENWGGVGGYRRSGIRLFSDPSD